MTSLSDILEGDDAHAPRPAYPITSVDNALRLLLALRDRQSLRLSEASQLIGCGRSTAHRLFSMLIYYGFARQDPESRIYHATHWQNDPASISARKDIVRAAKPVLQAVARATGETAHLSELRGWSIVFIESVEGANEVCTGPRRGVSYPAHCTSTGKAILAQTPLDVVRGIAGSGKLEQLTRASIGTFDELCLELDRVRERGYALNVGESQPGLFAIGAAIPAPPGLPYLAVSAAGPRSRLTRESAMSISRTVRRATDLIRSAIDESTVEQDADPDHALRGSASISQFRRAAQAAPPSGE